MCKSRLIAWPLRILVAIGIYFLLFALYWPGTSHPIPSGPGRYFVPEFIGAPAASKPLPGASIPQHPFMAPQGRNNMHGDAYISATYEQAGPLGIIPQVVSTAQNRLIGGQCATVTFDRHGRIVTYCSGFSETALKMLDPHTLAEIASYPLPQRPVNRTLNIRKIVKDTSGGAYFYLDDQDRAVLGLPDNTIKYIGQETQDDVTTFVLEKEYDLVPVLGKEDVKISAVLPDWDGRLWFVTRSGIVGTVDPESGQIGHVELTGEEIQNSFAVDQEAVYILSDYALYRFEADPSTGRPQVIWRESYDRGTRVKPGMINQGAGTTPTLFGDGYVAIADNAEPQINLLVYRRGREVEGTRLVCKQPVFDPGRSATENSLVGYGNSVIVENNYGYDIFTTMTFGRTSERGLIRVDVDEDGRGCHVVWTSTETSQNTVHKLSLGNGLLYAYTKSPDAPFLIDAFYFTAIDFETGDTVYKALTGTGLRYDNNWSPITIGPDGTAYVGTINGLVAIRDQPPLSETGSWSAANQRHTPLISLGLMLVSATIVVSIEALWMRRLRAGKRIRENNGG